MSSPGGLFNPKVNLAQQWRRRGPLPRGVDADFHVLFAEDPIERQMRLQRAQHRLFLALSSLRRSGKFYLRLEDLTADEVRDMSIDEYKRRRNAGEGT